VTVSLTRYLELAGEGGTSDDGDRNLRFVGVLASGRMGFGRTQPVTVSGGLGAGFYSFSFKANYGAVLNATGGGFYELQDLTLRGGGAYGTVRGDFSIAIGEGGALRAFAQYLGVGDQTTASYAGPLSVNASGTLLGVTLTIFM